MYKEICKITKNKNIYVTAILPAHNEADGIAKAVRSIRSHTDKIIVACDNCSDDTRKIALKAGADVAFDTVHNNYRKSGALNQALEKHVDWNIKHQYLLIMDADTSMSQPDRWFKKAVSLVAPNRPKLSKEALRIRQHPVKQMLFKAFHPAQYRRLFDGKAYDCIGSIFHAPQKISGNANIEEGQRLEWEAYMGKITRTRKVFVLTGTCSLISAEALHKVYLAHHKKYFYNEHSITEDFAMTVSLKEVNARLISPIECQCITEVKPSVKTLLAQRRRWNLGALQLCGRHKVDNVTLPYIGQQIMLCVSVVAFLLFLLTFAYIYLINQETFSWFWFAVFVVFDIDQVAKIWKYSNTFDKLYSISLVGWLFYSLMLQFAFIWALYSWVFNRKVYWNNKNKQEADQ